MRVNAEAEDSNQNVIENEGNSFKMFVMNLQKKIAFVSIGLIVIGGSIFAIGVLLRPILRLIWPDKLWIVSLTCDCMVLNGIFQLLLAGFSSFTSMWGIEILIYLVLGVTPLLIMHEFSTIGLTYFLYTKADTFVSELIYRAWYLWECAGSGSCKNAYLSYLQFYMLPQTVLISLAVFLQVLTMIYLFQFVRGIRARRLRIWPPEEDDAQNLEETPL